MQLQERALAEAKQKYDSLENSIATRKRQQAKVDLAEVFYSLDYASYNNGSIVGIQTALDEIASDRIVSPDTLKHIAEIQARSERLAKKKYKLVIQVRELTGSL